MRYHHRFTVDAPLEKVVDFHRSAASLEAITPPVIPMRFLGEPPPERLGEGDTITFRMWAGPIPIRWTAVIEGVTDTAFTDRQLQGPYATWTHRHTFEPVSDNETVVDDKIVATLPRHPLWALVAGQMWLGLPVLFAYRRWKTRRLLAG